MNYVLLFVHKLRLLFLLLPFLGRVFWSFLEDFIHSQLDKNLLYPLFLVIFSTLSSLAFIALFFFVLISTSSNSRKELLFFHVTDTFVEKLSAPEIEEPIKDEITQKKETEELLRQFVQKANQTGENSDQIDLDNETGTQDSIKQLYLEYQEVVTNQPTNWKLLYNAAVLAAKNNDFVAAKSYISQAENSL